MRHSWRQRHPSLVAGHSADRLNGAVPYLYCDGRLDGAVAAVEPHGGKVLEPAHPIGPHGFRAVALVSEGNRIALHSH